MEILISKVEERGIVELTAQVSASELGELAERVRFSADPVVHVTMQKTGDTFYLSGTITGELRLECSRCLGQFLLSVVGEVKGFYCRGSAGMDRDEVEVKLIPADAVSIGIDDELREAAILSIPIKPLCTEQCRGLCPVCGLNLNEGECACERSSVEPRFSALEELKHRLEAKN